METVIIIIAVICGVFCLVALVSLTHDIVNDVKSGKQNSQPQQATAPAVVVNNLPAERKEEDPPLIAEKPNAVSFAAEKKTFEDKFATLSDAAKGWYKEIVDYAAKIPDIKHRKNDRFEEFKIGSSRIVRLSIKRHGVFACEFVFENGDFKEYTKSNKLAVKTGVTELRITDSYMVEAAKKSIDIALDAAIENREYRQELAKERRRQNYRKQVAVAAAADDGEADN